MRKTQKRLFKIIAASLCSITMFMGTFVPVFAANQGYASGQKSNGSGQLYGESSMLRFSTSTACSAETMSTSTVNKQTVAISVQFKTGDSFWKPAKKQLVEMKNVHCTIIT